ncbi:MAG TPA: glycosyltransferase, partial [Acidimicrobiia bacterium]|nr:glycosyltransferase [Acidimicrobiia bacterium]
MSAHPTMTYVIAAYNEATSLPDSIPRIVERLRALPGSEVVIVENGSTDATAAVAAGLAQTYGAGPVIVRHETSAKGLG